MKIQKAYSQGLTDPFYRLGRPYDLSASDVVPFLIGLFEDKHNAGIVVPGVRSDCFR